MKQFIVYCLGITTMLATISSVGLILAMILGVVASVIGTIILDVFKVREISSEVDRERQQPSTNESSLNPRTNYGTLSVASELEQLTESGDTRAQVRLGETYRLGKEIPSMATADVLAEDDVTISNLNQIFKRAYFKTSLDKDGDLIIETDHGRVIVGVEKGFKLIKFMSLFKIKEFERQELKHGFTNTVNGNIILCRFSIPKARPEMLVADYYLPFEEGIPEFQIVSALRLFARVVVAAVRTCDETGLVE